MKSAGTPIASPIDVQLLEGTFARDGHVDALTCRERAFVALLAASTRPRSVYDVAESLWPDHDPESARNSAKVYASRVRWRFGRKDSICWNSAGYSLGDCVTVDIRRIEATIARARAATVPDGRLMQDAEAALDRIAGAPMAFRACPELERHLSGLAAGLATVLFEGASRRGDHQRAVRAGLGLVAFDPCEELGRELVIRGRLALGDELGAYCAFREYARTLHDELDAEPSERLRALFPTGRKYVSDTHANTAGRARRRLHDAMIDERRGA